MEFLPWCGELRIQLQRFGSLRSTGQGIKGSGFATGRAWIQPLAWELPYAGGEAVQKNLAGFSY